jgi:hypothetical protein
MGDDASNIRCLDLMATAASAEFTECIHLTSMIRKMGSTFFYPQKIFDPTVLWTIYVRAAVVLLSLERVRTVHRRTRLSSSLELANETEK